MTSLLLNHQARKRHNSSVGRPKPDLIVDPVTSCVGRIGRPTHAAVRRGRDGNDRYLSFFSSFSFSFFSIFSRVPLISNSCFPPPNSDSPFPLSLSPSIFSV